MTTTGTQTGVVPETGARYTSDGTILRLDASTMPVGSVYVRSR